MKTIHILFHLDPDNIEDRLRRKPTLLEVFALAFPIGLCLVFAYLSTSAAMPFGSDFDVYMHTARGIFTDFYYAYWSLPIFRLLALLPGEHTAYLVWCILNVAGVWFAVRVFAGRAPLALLSYQMLFICFYGQITGVIVGGLALLWWSLNRRRWALAGLGAAVALIKWQMGIPLCLALVLLADVSWYGRLRALWVLLIVVLVSLVAYPNWVFSVMDRLINDPPIRFGDVSLWGYFGALSLVLWLPTLLLPMSAGRRYAAICATGALAVPYFQQTGLLALFVLPLGWFPLIGNLPYLFFWVRDTQLEFVSLVPLLAYVWIHVPPLRAWISQFGRRVQVATA